MIGLYVSFIVHRCEVPAMGQVRLHVPQELLDRLGNHRKTNPGVPVHGHDFSGVASPTDINALDTPVLQAVVD